MKDRHDIVRRRLLNQRLLGKPFRRPADVVAFHLAMQSQDFGGAKWAIGQRLAAATEAAVDAAFDRGAILRTHVMRPTWHFVTPADARWLLELTAPRVRAISAPYLKKHGLNAAALKKSRRVIEKELAAGQRTRDELARALAAVGLPVKGEALSYQMIAAELDAVVISGARRGKQHTYALFDERVPASAALGRDEALAQLAQRYLHGHGPALPQDLAWWSGLTLADAKRGIAAVQDTLETASVDGKTYWFNRGRTVSLDAPAVHLIPNYDEQLIAYRYRGNAVDTALSAKLGPGSGVFDGHLVLIDGLLVGGWRRELTSKSVEVSVNLLRSVRAVERDALAATAQRYAEFLGLELVLSVERS